MTATNATRSGPRVTVCLAIVLALAGAAACGGGDDGSSLPPGSGAAAPPTGWSALELRVTAVGSGASGSGATGAFALDAGAPLLLEVVVDNLEAVRAVNARGGTRPTGDEEPLPAVTIDGDDPWEARVTFEVTGADGAPALDGYDWNGALQGGMPQAAGRTAGFEVQRATWIVSPRDLAGLAGDLTITASLAPPEGSGDSLVSAPLVVTLADASQAATAAGRYGEAKAHELRGDWQAAIDAAEEALALDPQLFDAMEVVAKGHLQLGDTATAIEWYERYLATFPSDDVRDGYPRVLRRFVDSLRDEG